MAGVEPLIVRAAVPPARKTAYKATALVLQVGGIALAIAGLAPPTGIVLVTAGVVLAYVYYARVEQVALAVTGAGVVVLNTLRTRKLPWTEVGELRREDGTTWLVRDDGARTRVQAIVTDEQVADVNAEIARRRV